MTDTDNQIAEDRCLSIKQAADKLGVHYLTMRSYILNGYIQTVPFGRRHRIREEEVERFKKYGNYVSATAIPIPPSEEIPENETEVEL